MRDSQVAQPISEYQQVWRHRAEGAYLPIHGSVARGDQHAGDDGLLVHVEAATSRVNNVHPLTSHSELRQRWSAMNSQISPTCSALPGGNTQDHWARSQAAYESGSRHQMIPPCSATAQAE